MSIEMDRTGIDTVPIEGEHHEGLLETLGANVMPILATGVSLIWLISSIRGTPPIPGKVRRAASRLGDRASSALAPMGEKAGDMIGQVRERAVDLSQKVQEKASDLSHRVQGSAAGTTEGAAFELGRLIEEKPLVVCGAAALVGAAIGFLVPESQKEHALLGPVKDNIVEKARAIVEDMKENAKARVETGLGRAAQAIDDLAHPEGDDEAARLAQSLNEDLSETTREGEAALTDAYFGPAADEATEPPLSPLEEGSEFDHAEDLLAEAPSNLPEEEERRNL